MSTQRTLRSTDTRSRRRLGRDPKAPRKPRPRSTPPAPDITVRVEVQDEGRDSEPETVIGKGKKMLEDHAGWVAGAVSVAATAAAGIAAFKTRGGSERSVLHLMPHEDGWQVTRQGADEPELVCERKRDARKRARSAAHDCEPSQLVIHRTDGTIQTVHTYGE